MFFRCFVRRFWIAGLLVILFFPLCAARGEDSLRHYVLACPFCTVRDSVSAEELREMAQGAYAGNSEIRTVLWTPEAAADLISRFPEIPADLVSADAAEKILDGTCAVIPIEMLDPTMKALRVGRAVFPWDEVYDPATDILAVRSDRPDFDPSLVTTVLLTGTTALARTVAYKMSVNGPQYPGELIKSVFDASDITHISSESSIWSLCPEPRIDNRSIQFCSNSDAAELFDYLGVDVIELSGNHLRDYDWKPLQEMLDGFDAEGRLYYAAGHTPQEAAAPLFLSHNGNNFAFIGCNIAGPDHVFVDDLHPGVNKCDFDLLETEIRKLSAEGFLVIVTLQYYEIYSRTPSEHQERDFRRLSDAGAVIVSGSQSHFSQTMLPLPDRFIHYGLGNLFFDQMDIPVKGTRQELLDRYVFYDGRLLNVQLVTALLTDYCRPRLMTDTERADFLQLIFDEM